MADTEIVAWIPVDLRLPDDDTMVLIALKHQDGEPVWIGYREGDQWYSDDAMPQLVTHWMPMPAGPNG